MFLGLRPFRWRSPAVDSPFTPDAHHLNRYRRQQSSIRTIYNADSWVDARGRIWLAAPYALSDEADDAEPEIRRQAMIGTRVTTAQRCCRVDAWRSWPISRSLQLLNNLRDVLADRIALW